MPKRIAISIEENNVKIIFAKKQGKKIVVTDLFKTDIEKLDNVIKTKKANDFLVSIVFKNYFYNTIYLPPAKPRYIYPLLKRSIAQSHPNAGELIFDYFILGEKFIEGRLQKEVFYYAVPRSEVEEIINVFTRRKKIIISLCPDIFPLTGILPDISDPYLCLFMSGDTRTYILLKNKMIYFLRTSKGVSDMDIINIKDINMTVNYCRQRIKINPSYIFILGEQVYYENVEKQQQPSLTENITLSNETEISPLIPVVSYLPPDNLSFKDIETKSTFSDFILPISMIYRPKVKSFFPPNYALFLNLNKYLNKSILIFTALIIFLVITVLPLSMSVLTKKYEVNNIQSEIVKMDEIYNKYASLKENIEKNKSLYKVMKMERMDILHDKLLVLISNAYISGVEINEMKIDRKDTSIDLEINGSLKAIESIELKKSFWLFLGSLKKINGIDVNSEKLDPVKRIFTVKVSYSEKRLIK